MQLIHSPLSSFFVTVILFFKCMFCVFIVILKVDFSERETMYFRVKPLIHSTLCVYI